jgi:thiosulfate/3-mercaptopyruvate sulfurtransferase
MGADDFGPLVSAGWLVENLGAVRVVDASVLVSFDADGVRSWVNGSAAFHEAGHIPAAVHADLIHDFSAAGPEEFALPGSGAFAEAVGALGIGNDDTIVVYDSTSMTWATRLRWLFRHFGHERVAVLDGGLQAWTRAGGRIETGAAIARPAAPFTAGESGETLIDTEEVKRAQATGDVLIVSALPARDFSGEKSMRPRPGHIPGSLSIPAASLLDHETGGLAPLDVLRDRLAPILERESSSILHCGSGVSATLPLLALELLGRRDILFYEDSLNAWAQDPTNPLDTIAG